MNNYKERFQKETRETVVINNYTLWLEKRLEEAEGEREEFNNAIHKINYIMDVFLKDINNLPDVNSRIAAKWAYQIAKDQVHNRFNRFINPTVPSTETPDPEKE